MEYSISFDNATNTIICKGKWDKQSVFSLSKKFDMLRLTQNFVSIDVSKISSIDTAGAMFVLSMVKSLHVRKIDSNIIGANGNIAKILELCKINDKPIPKEPKKPFFINAFFYNVGEKSVKSLDTLLFFFSFVGGVSGAFMGVVVKPTSLRFKSTLFHMQQNGLNALPIVALISFLIGVVIAFQGAVQLEKFGANIFIVEMVGISATRELAPLIVAIVIAGRSASSFTAELGVMKITEEVDAMRTLGFNPWDFLVLPRVLALVVVMPLLIIFADFVSIFGGMMVAKGELGISFYEFLARFRETVALKNIIIGLVKAPIFGYIIALIGCFRGFEITSSTQSVGKYTTISVVNAIFWVIAFDALASLFLTRLGI